MTGFNLPPGCSVRDIERACGAEADSSPEADSVYAAFDPLIDRVGSVRKLLARDLRAALDSALITIDRLVADRADFERLLEAALPHMPPDPVCKCAGGAGDAPHDDCCPVAGTMLEIGELTPRGEIEAALRTAALRTGGNGNG